MISASAMRLVALDDQGEPTGEWVELGPGRLRVWSPPEDDEPITIPREISLSMGCHVDLMRNATLRAVFALRLTPRGVRLRRYWQRTHGHAPRRRNRHGRVGVRR